MIGATSELITIRETVSGGCLEEGSLAASDWTSTMMSVCRRTRNYF